MKKLAFILSTLCLLSGCGQKENGMDCLTLSVDLDKSTLQYEEVFSDAEVIPLETTDSSLVVYPVRLIEHKGNYYLYDIHTVNALSFDHQGKFVRKGFCVN